MIKQISIVIVTYNSSKLIFDCLDSIYKYNDIGNGLEIIIVDNCSVDRDIVFAKIRSDYPADIILIKSPVNKGYGHGNNQGINIAQARHVVIMNPDVRLVEPIFLKIIAKFNTNPKIGILGVKFIDGSNHLYFKPEHDNLLRMIFSRFLIKYQFYNIGQMFFSGSFLIFDKYSFLKAGAFDENIFLFHEEADISNRIISIGYETEIANDIFVRHLAHGREVNSYLLKVGAESRMYYFKKYHIDLIKYYSNKLLFYRIKYIAAIILLNKNKKAEFYAWIRMCKNKGNI